MKWIQKYTGWLRRVKLNYFIHNWLFSRKWLKGPAKRLRQLNPSINPMLTVRHSDLPYNGVKNYPVEEDSSDAFARFQEQGYLTQSKWLSDDQVSLLLKEVDDALKSGEAVVNYSGTKIMDAWKVCPTIRDVAKDPKLIELLSSLMGEEVVPFQTIYFNTGSEQAAHSDYFHMTTYPEFGLIAVWIALEPIDEENGPVYYYPGSHHWKPLFNEDLGLSDSRWLLDENPNRSYEKGLETLIASKSVQPEKFTADTGDALIWHANLVHGGSTHKNKNRSRKSLVIHYFAKNAICYHEISQRLAVVKPF